MAWLGQFRRGLAGMCMETDIQLRDYQVVAIRQVFDAWRNGYRSVILASPTGSGKRVMALWLMQYAANAGRRVLFVGNRRLLINQAQGDAMRYGIDHGVLMADSESGNAASTNQIASIHSLESWYFYEKFSDVPTGRGLPRANLLIVDEGHQDTARYEQLLAFYPDAKVLVLSATPVGPEGKSLVPRPYELLLEPIKNSQLIADGYLLPTRVFAPSEPFLDGVKIVKRQEYNQTQLGRRVHECHCFGDVESHWLPYSDQATVVFVPGVPFAHHLAEQFNNRFGKGTAHAIEAKTKHEDRESAFRALRETGRGVVISVDVLREGWDLPVVSCAIDLQPNKQLRSYWQKVGRVKRPAPGQEHAVLLDFSGNYWRFPHPDEDPEWPQGGEEDTQELVKKSRTEKGEAEPIMCPKCSFVRQKGPTCPNCGHTSGQAIRRIRMGDGRLVEVSAVKRQAHVQSVEEKMFAKWKQRLFGALRSGLTYSQCAAIFHREHGQMPKHGWPGTFPANDIQWRRKPVNDYNFKTWAETCRHYERKLRDDG